MKNLKDLFKNKLIMRYIVTYVLFMVIPVIVFTMITFNYYINILWQETQTRNGTNLERLRVVVESRIDQMQRAAYQLLLNEDILKNERKDDILSDVAMINIIEKMYLRIDFVDRIYLYSQAKQSIYTSSTKIDLQKANKTIFNYMDMENEQIIKFLNAIHKNTTLFGATVMENNVSKEVMVFIVLEGEKSDAKQQRLAMFIVDKEKFAQALKKEEIIILDNDGNIVFSTISNRLMNETAAKLADGFQNISSSGRVEDEKYYVSYLNSIDKGLRYLLFTDMDKALESIVITKRIFLLGILLILLIVFIVMPFVIRKQYNPIRDIKILAMKRNADKNDKNDLEFIKDALKGAYDENQDLDLKLRSNETAIKEHLIIKLMRGEYANLEEYNKKATEYGVAFDDGFLNIILIFCDSNVTYDDEKLKNAINIADIKGYFTGGVTSGNLSLIMYHENSTPDKSKITKLANIIKQFMGESPVLGVGNAYDDISLLWRSYIEAKTALDHRIVSGESEVIYFNECTNEQEVPDYSWNDKIDILSGFVRFMQRERAEEMVDIIINEIKEKHYSLFAARCVVYDVVNSVIKTMYNNRPASRSIEILNNFTNFGSIDDLHEMLKLICNDLIKSYQVAEVGKDSLIDTIVKTMEEEFYKNHFSAQWLGEQFGMSNSNISKYFKLHKGVTIKDYLNLLEVERAKVLLIQTEMPIADIALEIGQQDVSNFIRKFKKKIGVTPGEYRELRGDV